jgi:hypothetical protein
MLRHFALGDFVKNREKTGFGSTGPSAGLLIDVFFC